MEVLREAEVICGQLLTAGGDFLKPLGPLRALLIDEVAQATELNAIVPIVARGCERLVLVGDQCQLPPSVRSREAETRGLSLSLFGRFIALGVQPHFLDTQVGTPPYPNPIPALTLSADPKPIPTLPPHSTARTRC